MHFVMWNARPEPVLLALRAGYTASSASVAVDCAASLCKSHIWKI